MWLKADLHVGWRLRKNGLASAISEITFFRQIMHSRRNKTASAVNISFCFFWNSCYSQKFTLSYWVGGGVLFINIATASKLKKQQQKSELGNVLVFSVSIKILPHITPKSEHLFCAYAIHGERCSKFLISLPSLQAMFPNAVSIMDIGEEITAPHMCTLCPHKRQRDYLFQPYP